MLRLQSCGQHSEERGDARAVAGARLGPVAVLLPEVLRDRFGEAAGLLETGVHQLQAARPAEAILSANFVRETKHDGACRGIDRKQRRSGRKTLGKQKDLGPARAWSLLFEDSDRT